MPITKDFFKNKLVSRSELGSMVLKFLKEHSDMAYSQQEIVTHIDIDKTIYDARTISHCLSHLVERNELLKKHSFYLFNNSLDEHKGKSLDVDALDFSVFRIPTQIKRIKAGVKKVYEANASLTLDNLRESLGSSTYISKSQFNTFIIRNGLRK